MKISVLDWKTVSLDNDMSPDRLGEFGDLTVHDATAPSQAVENIGDADIVLCNKVPITQDVMDCCPKIKYIGLFATGYNNVDVGYAAKKGIPVCNAGQYSTAAVAQLVFAYILDYYSRVRLYDRTVRDGGWESAPVFSYFIHPTYELSGKTISVVGYGSIGKAVASIADAFGMRVVICTRTRPKECKYILADLETAAREADILTVHCPLTEDTKWLVCEKLLRCMKKTAVLINTSRGGVVNEYDLACALKNGMIAGAYLDVLDKEPMSPDTPLRGIENCIITPHIAWAPLETRKRLLDIVCDNLRAWQQGSPVNKVN